MLHLSGADPERSLLGGHQLMKKKKLWAATSEVTTHGDGMRNFLLFFLFLSFFFFCFLFCCWRYQLPGGQMPPKPPSGSATVSADQQGPVLLVFKELRTRQHTQIPPLLMQGQFWFSRSIDRQRPRSIGLFLCLLQAYSLANRTGSPQGFYKTVTLHKYYNHYINILSFCDPP